MTYGVYQYRARTPTAVAKAHVVREIDGLTKGGQKNQGSHPPLGSLLLVLVSRIVFGEGTTRQLHMYVRV